MKINRIILLVVGVLALTACDEDAQFDKELYKKVICILSDADQSFSVYHDLGQPETTGYISILYGGTKHIEKDVVVELERDEELLSRYNKLNFDIDSAKFVRELAPDHYTIESLSTVLRVDKEDPYNTIPVRVRPEGLSPDSVYAIPLRIKSVSDYEINSQKNSILYRVVLKNDYALQSPTTYYRVRGTDILFKENGEEDKRSTFSLSRVVAPLTKNSIRCFVGMNTYEVASLTQDAVRKYGMSISVNEDNTIALEALGTAQIELIEDTESNYMYNYSTNLYSVKLFELHYRYRLLKDGADGNNGDTDYGVWHEMRESMSYTESVIP